MHNATSSVKRAQKESLYERELSTLLMRIKLDTPELMPLFISRVQLSADKGTCFVFFFVQEGEETFEKLMPTLILFKPSLRKALSTKIPGRYTPELVFKYDTQFEKQKRIEDILNKLKNEDGEEEKPS